MKLLNSLIISFALFFTTFTQATTFSIEGPYVRATPPHTKNSAAFMVIKNNSDTPLKLISASSDIADRVELHTHTMNDGVMQMRQVDSISIDASGSTELRPGSFHVMFLGLKAPLAEGNKVNLTLYFDNGEEIVVDAPIKKITMQKKMTHSH